MLGLTVHRLSASKEISNILNKYVHAVSYNHIRLQNEHWVGEEFLYTFKVIYILTRQIDLFQTKESYVLL